MQENEPEGRYPIHATHGEVAAIFESLESKLQLMEAGYRDLDSTGSNSRFLRSLRNMFSVLIEKVVPQLGFSEPLDTGRLAQYAYDLRQVLDRGLNWGDDSFGTIANLSQELLNQVRQIFETSGRDLEVPEMLLVFQRDLQDASAGMLGERRDSMWDVRVEKANLALNESQVLNGRLSNALEEIRQISDDIRGLKHETSILRTSAKNDSSNAFEALRSAETVKGQLEEALANARILTTDNATNELTRNFAAYRRTHALSYMSFMRFAIIGFVVTVALATVLSIPGVLSGAEGVSTWPATVWRIALVSGLLGVSTFLAKQAVHHRAQSQWADSIQVQLKTFKAYTDLLPESAQRDLLRAEFARRIFGPEPSVTNKNSDTQSKDDVSIGAMQEVLDLLKSMKSITGEGKPTGNAGAPDN